MNAEQEYLRDLASRIAEYAAKMEMKHIRDIIQGMSVQYSMKDTNTFCREPGRIRKWVDMAMEIAGA